MRALGQQVFSAVRDSDVNGFRVLGQHTWFHHSHESPARLPDAEPCAASSAAGTACGAPSGCGSCCGLLLASAGSAGAVKGMRSHSAMLPRPPITCEKHRDLHGTLLARYAALRGYQQGISLNPKAKVSDVHCRKIQIWWAGLAIVAHLAQYTGVVGGLEGARGRRQQARLQAQVRRPVQLLPQCRHAVALQRRGLRVGVNPRAHLADHLPQETRFGFRVLGFRV